MWTSQGLNLGPPDNESDELASAPFRDSWCKYRPGKLA